MKDALTLWIQETILGLPLCPFAAPVWRRDLVRVHLSEAATPEAALFEALHQAQELLQTPAEELSTTLVAFPHALQDFSDFLEAAATLEDLLIEAGAEGVLQVATFHPDYCFEGCAPKDLSNYTNKAPCPVLHLLREDEVSQAITSHPDPEGIPDHNINKLEKMGSAQVKELWGRFMPPS